MRRAISGHDSPDSSWNAAGDSLQYERRHRLSCQPQTLTASVSGSISLPHPFICARFTRYSLLARTVDDQGAGRAGDGVVIGRKADL